MNASPGLNFIDVFAGCGDALREAMTDPWERLSAAEREMVAGLSKDLYTITDQSK